ncbi:MAG: transcriptional repressor [Demequinaceae bacterium]|nr:transcriptional repressor [Demequinaceae bacterium]
MSDAPQPALPRMTRQRAAVLVALESSEDFLSAQQWHESLRDHGSAIGLATVYRTLQALAETGEVDAVRDAAGEVLYRRCGNRTRHHHHLRCRECGAAVEIEGPGVEEWASGIGERYGYSHVEHMIELTGLCRRCTTKEG